MLPACNQRANTRSFDSQNGVGYREERVNVSIPNTVETASLQAPVDAALFRSACSNFATGVTVVTANTPAGPHGGTVNAFTSLSVDPPQIIVCLNKNSNTWRAVESSRQFGVSILASNQHDIARVFASKMPNKMASVDWEYSSNGIPILSNTIGTFECRLNYVTEQATHMLLIGSVLNAAFNPSKSPLVFFRSALHSGINSAPTS